jgi:hypothetical protein
MQVLDYFCRPPTRVNRDTFDAELYNALNDGDYGMLLRGIMRKVAHGLPEAHELMRVVEGQGDEMEVHVPNDGQLLCTVQSLRDRLEAGRINAMHRVYLRHDVERPDQGSHIAVDGPGRLRERDTGESP